jgi:ribosomal-protein-alanine N-acetyltransferase
LDEECFAVEFRFSRETMRQFVGRRGAIVVVAEVSKDGGVTEGGDVVGFCIVHMEGHGPAVRGYVVTLDVAEGWRRRGLANELMEEVETRALVAGATAMDLHVWTGNDGAIRFYEGRGYERAGLVKRFYRAAGLDAFIYRKVLATG